jgi:hypothetical protein
VTVGELKALLDGYPDNTEVLVPLPTDGGPNLRTLAITRVAWQHFAVAESNPNVPFFGPGNAGPGSHVALTGPITEHKPPGGR